MGFSSGGMLSNFLDPLHLFTAQPGSQAAQAPAAQAAQAPQAPKAPVAAPVGKKTAGGAGVSDATALTDQAVLEKMLLGKATVLGS